MRSVSGRKFATGQGDSSLDKTLLIKLKGFQINYSYEFNLFLNMILFQAIFKSKIILFMLQLS